jgi:hypothetical protein
MGTRNPSPEPMASRELKEHIHETALQHPLNGNFIYEWNFNKCVPALAATAFTASHYHGDSLTNCERTCDGQGNCINRHYHKVLLSSSRPIKRCRKKRQQHECKSRSDVVGLVASPRGYIFCNGSKILASFHCYLFTLVFNLDNRVFVFLETNAHAILMFDRVPKNAASVSNVRYELCRV